MSWIQNHLRDTYVKKRIMYNYISRSYFKLEEIQKKYNIIYKNTYALDLGACPGGWTQYLQKYTKNITAVDINNNWKMNNIPLIQKDIFDLQLDYQFDLIVSDIACDLTGNNDIDEPCMSVIIEQLLVIIKKYLRPNGNFVCKLFAYNQYVLKEHKMFKQQYFFKPQSSKQESAEIYFVGKGFIW